VGCHDEVLPRDARTDRDLAVGAPRSRVVELSGEAAAMTAPLMSTRTAVMVLIALAAVCAVLVFLAGQGAH